MKTKVQELYEEWCGEDRHVNDCHPVHDSSETIEFAEYYYNAMKELEKDVKICFNTKCVIHPPVGVCDISFRCSGYLSESI